MTSLSCALCPVLLYICGLEPHTLFCKTSAVSFCPSVSVILLSVFHYSALFGLFLLDAVQLELFFDVFPMCSVYVEAAIFTKNKLNKTHINLIFFSLNEEKKSCSKD